MSTEAQTAIVMAMQINTYAGDVRLVGGRICLDFINTVNSHKQAQPKEYLVDYAAMLIWSRHAGVLNAATCAALASAAAHRPDAAAAALERARVLRAALYQIFSAIANQRPPAAMSATAGAARDLAVLNSELAQAPRHVQLAHAPEFQLAWHGNGDALEQPLWHILWSTVDLLTSAERAHVGECQGEGCSWLFFDTRRNRSRRWCSMEDCGNRAKARRHYVRKQDRID